MTASSTLAEHPMNIYSFLVPMWPARRRRWLGGVAAASLLAACQANEPRGKTVGATLTGLDHLEAHLSIQNFWVNGAPGHQAGKGGRTVCCIGLPEKAKPGETVKVRWGVTNWAHKAYSLHEREVPLERRDPRGVLYIHFLRDGSVRAVLYDGYPEKRGYPGPAYDTVLRKHPWDVYLSEPGEPLFKEVPDAMALGGAQ